MWLMHNKIDEVEQDKIKNKLLKKYLQVKGLWVDFGIRPKQ